MRTVLAAAVALLAACLSTPPPGDPDGSTARCATGARTSLGDWPPVETPSLEVQTAVIADVDGDEIEDLVVAVAPDVAGANAPSRVHILYGPVSATSPQYQTSLDTSEPANVSPWGISLDDLDGDDCLDLTVAGPSSVTGGSPYLAIWRHDGTLDPWRETARRSALSQPPQDRPMLIAWADLSDAAALDVAVANKYEIDVFVGAGAGEIANAQLVPKPEPCGDWDGVAGLRAVRRTDGRDKLLVFGLTRYNVVDDDGTGALRSTDDCEQSTRPLNTGIVPYDLDGSPPDDLLFGAENRIAAYQLSLQDGETLVAPTASDLPVCPGTPRSLDFRHEGAAIGDLGGFPLPEIAVIDFDPVAVESWLCLIDGVRVQDGQWQSAASPEIMIGSRPVRVVLIGQLGGDRRRVWTLDVDGTLRCFQRQADMPALEACP